MNTLSSPFGTATSTCNKVMMVGTSPGEPEDHLTDLSLDVIPFLDAFKRECKNSAAIPLFLANGWPSGMQIPNDGDKFLAVRIEVLRSLVEEIVPDCIFMDPVAMQRYDLLPNAVPDKSGKVGRAAYTEWQTNQILAVHRAVKQEGFAQLHKFGWWAVDDGATNTFSGGEMAFDKALPAETAIEFVYTEPGRYLRGGAKAPYLVHRKSIDSCLLIGPKLDSNRQLAKIEGDLLGQNSHQLRKLVKVFGENPEGDLIRELRIVQAKVKAVLAQRNVGADLKSKVSRALRVLDCNSRGDVLKELYVVYEKVADILNGANLDGHFYAQLKRAVKVMGVDLEGDILNEMHTVYDKLATVFKDVRSYCPPLLPPYCTEV